MPRGCQAPEAERKRERDLRGVIGNETPLNDTVMAYG